MHRAHRTAQRGFSLLEMLVALGILSAAAYVAVDTMDGDVGQRRFEQTQNRLDKIRKAIVGNPDLSLNGAPVISGYVADVGALPRCLDALLVRQPDCDGNGVPDDEVTEPLVYPAPAAYGAVGVSGLRGGWRGPYISAGARGIVDAWGNGRQWTNGAEDGGNYGWIVQLRDEDGDVYRDTGGGAGYGQVTTSAAMNPTDVFVDLSLKSKGRNLVGELPVAGAVFDYDADQYLSEQIFDTGDAPYDPLTDDDYAIRPADYSVDPTGGIDLFVTNTQPADLNICMALAVLDNSAADKWKLLISDGNADPSLLHAVIPANSTDVLVSFNSSERAAVGIKRLIVFDADTARTTGISCEPSSDTLRDELVSLDVSTPTTPTDLFLKQSVALAPRVAMAFVFRISI